MIRILALAAINQGFCKIRLNGILGDDIESMIRSLQSIGVNITKQFDKKRSTGARFKRSVIVYDFEKKVDNLSMQSLVILIEFKTYR